MVFDFPVDVQRDDIYKLYKDWSIHVVDVVGLTALQMTGDRFNGKNYHAVYEVHGVVEPGTVPFFYVKYGYFEAEYDKKAGDLPNKVIFNSRVNEIVTDGESYSSVDVMSGSVIPDVEDFRRFLVDGVFRPVPPRLLDALGSCI